MARPSASSPVGAHPRCSPCGTPLNLLSRQSAPLVLPLWQRYPAKPPHCPQASSLRWWACLAGLLKALGLLPRRSASPWRCPRWLSPPKESVHDAAPVGLLPRRSARGPCGPAPVACSPAGARTAAAAATTPLPWATKSATHGTPTPLQHSTPAKAAATRQPPQTAQRYQVARPSRSSSDSDHGTLPGSTPNPQQLYQVAQPAAALPGSTF